MRDIGQRTPEKAKTPLVRLLNLWAILSSIGSEASGFFGRADILLGKIASS
jgi:hypothetical protein